MVEKTVEQNKKTMQNVETKTAMSSNGKINFYQKKKWKIILSYKLTTDILYSGDNRQQRKRKRKIE